MTSYKYKLTEEIARYAFEVKLKESKGWFLAFTNPTAGPWKKITAKDELGEEREVYRFERDEARPDLLLVHDERKIILIIEAKDSLNKLVKENQMKKSAKVVITLAEKLKLLRQHPNWAYRADYTIVAGLLWGSEVRSSVHKIESASTIFYKALKKEIKKKTIDIFPSIISIESYKNKEGGITCFGHVFPPQEAHLEINQALLEMLPVWSDQI